MSRVIASCAVIFGSVVLYIGLRYLKEYKTSIGLQNLIMFGPTTVLFGFYTYISGGVFLIDTAGFLSLFAISFAFSWLGNRCSLISLKYAPNAGYSLMISKSYVILTAVLAVFLFNAPLTIVDCMAIGLVVIFACMLLYEKKVANKTYSKIWILYALLAFLLWAGLALANKWLLVLGYMPSTINFWMFFCVFIISAIELLIKPEKVMLKAIGIRPLILIVIGMFLFNWGLMEGYKLAPNPGYISAANTSSIALLALASAVLFKDPLSWKKVVAMLGISVGIVLLFLY